MRTRKIIEAIEQKMNIIEEKINNINDETSKKAKKYEETQDLLNHIKLKVKNVSIFADENGNYSLKVEYHIPAQIITFDSMSNVIKNNTFYSINKLNLVSFEDMKKIQSKIDEVKKKNSNNI